MNCGNINGPPSDRKFYFQICLGRAKITPLCWTSRFENPVISAILMLDNIPAMLITYTLLYISLVIFPIKQVEKQFYWGKNAQMNLILIIHRPICMKIYTVFATLFYNRFNTIRNTIESIILKLLCTDICMYINHDYIIFLLCV